MILKYILSLTIVCALMCGGVYAQKFNTIQTYTGASCGDCFLVKAGQKYTFTNSDISPNVLPENSVDRLVFFNNRISLPLYVTDTKSSYRIRVTYLSDSKDRVIKVIAGNSTLQNALKIPYGKPVTETYDIPLNTYKEGSFTLSFIALSGANVAISRFEVLSTGNKNLVYKDLLADKIKSFSYTPTRLSPKPAKVKGITMPVVSLNGTWNFNFKTQKGKIQVPGEWGMQGYKVDSAEKASYTTSFKLPNDWKGKRVKLRFDGVSSYCQIFVNDVLLGEHEGGFVIFEIDVSKAVQIGENKLEVKVASQTISDKIGCVSQYAAHTVGGILRKVSLVALADINIGEITPVVKFDRDYQNADLTVHYQIFNESTRSADAYLKYILLDASGDELTISGNQTEKRIIKNDVATNGMSILKINNPKHWNTEHPYLYTLVTQLISKGDVQQENRQKVGFRQIDIRGNQFFVNNKVIKLHGANRHDVGALSGRSVSAEVNLSDAIAFRNANCNYIRTSHYPPAEELLDACDSLGIFVEAEAPITWVEHHASPIWKQWDYLNPDFLPYFMTGNMENIRGNRNHPSIIIWSIANESRWSPIWEKVNADVKKYDPSRPTAFHDQTYGGFNNAGSKADIRNMHYPGMSGPEKTDEFKDRPVLFGEYCHVQTYNRLEEVTDPYIRVDWGRMLNQMYNKMYVHESCLGGAIWAGVDDIFHMPDSTIVGYGPWGAILDAWRREKPEFVAVRKSYAPFIITNLKDARPENGVLSLKIQNRYNFANIKEGKITYTVDGKTMYAIGDIPARSAGVLNLNMPDETASVLITFTDPRGFVAQEELLTFKNKPDNNAQAKNITVSLKETSEQTIVSAGEKKYSFNKTTGLLENNNILGSLAVMIVPMNGDDGGAPDIAGNNYQRNIHPLLYKPEQAWKTSAITSKIVGNDVSVTVEGDYSNLKGSYTYTFFRNGTIDVAYNFKFADSTSINPRQWGLAFELNSDFQHLNYTSKGYWSIYPTNDIARTTGDIHANPVHLKYVEDPLRVPSGPWSADANDLGSRDFRSTKANIYNGTLSNDKGSSLTVLSDGSQSLRSWIDGDKTRFLIAELNGGGSDGFFAGYYSKERKPLKKGSQLSGVVKLKIQD